MSNLNNKQYYHRAQDHIYIHPTMQANYMCSISSRMHSTSGSSSDKNGANVHSVGKSLSACPDGGDFVLHFRSLIFLVGSTSNQKKIMQAQPNLDVKIMQLFKKNANSCTPFEGNIVILHIWRYRYKDTTPYIYLFIVYTYWGYRFFNENIDVITLINMVKLIRHWKGPTNMKSMRSGFSNENGIFISINAIQDCRNCYWILLPVLLILVNFDP